jgi:hypothetical protein
VIDSLVRLASSGSTVVGAILLTALDVFIPDSRSVGSSVYSGSVGDELSTLESIVVTAL